jgi:DNA-binding SARP family transcriptional activator/predicted ATPase/ribosomal protein S18 acetylase RimI-like enzyme
MPKKLELTLLGAPTVRLGDEPVTGFRSKKAQALLFYLAVTGHPHTRPALAGLLWGEFAESQARVNLNKTLSNLRELVGDHLLVDRDTVAFHPESAHDLDITHFVTAATAALAQRDRAALTQVADCYRGDFLAGFYIDDAPGFETWLLHERARLREQILQVLYAVADQAAAHGDLAQALDYTRRILTLEPWREEAHRQLMLLLAQNGERSAALNQYGVCRQTLADELAVEPAAETTELYYRIRAGQVEPVERTARPAPAEALPAPSPTPPPPRLPPQLTPFIGRNEEVTLLVERLGDPACRLLTLVGPGGIGKTRLAVEVAQRLVDGQPDSGDFPDGIVFVALAAVDSINGAVAAIAAALGYHFQGQEAAQQQLLDFLRPRQMLLVLDNVEQLRDGAGSLSALLAAAPGVRLLLTTREALNLQEAWFHPLAGLAFPDLTAKPDQPVAAYDAVQLFAQSARRARGDFMLAGDEQSVVRICQLVGGMPLALELAAAWLRLLPAAKVAQEIERGIDILTARHQNLPERHRSLRAVLEQTWAMLSPTEATVARRLALFRGGFEQEAAEAVAGATLLTLAGLVEKSLLRATATGRYQMHELLRQFAAEQLAADAAEQDVTRTRHAAYFLAYLAEREPLLMGKEQSHALTEIGAEIANILAGWQQAVAQPDLATLEPAVDALYRYYWIHGRAQEGVELLAQAAIRLSSIDEHPESHQLDLVCAKLDLRQGMFYYFLGDYGAATNHLTAAQQRAQSLDRKLEVAMALNMLGVIAGVQGKLALARQQMEQSLALFRTVGHRDGVADTLHELAQLCSHEGNFAGAMVLATESLTISRQLERPDWIGSALDALGWATFCLGDYDAATAYYQESLATFEHVDHQLGRALAQGGLALVAWAQGRLDDARRVAEQSLAICRTVNHRLHTATRLTILALIAHEQGDITEARRRGQEGMKLIQTVGSPVFRAYNLALLATVAVEGKDLPARRRYLIELLRNTAAFDLLPSLTMLLYQLASLLVEESELPERTTAGPAQSVAQACEVLAVVQQHPSCWRVFRDRAAQLEQHILAGLSQAEAATVLSHRPRRLGDIVKEILAPEGAEQLRPATVADLPQMIELDRAIFGSYGADEDPAVIRARLEVFPAGCVVLEETTVDGAPGVLLGYLTTEKWATPREPALDEDPHTTHAPQGRILNITTLAVHPAHQNRGLGQRLLDEAIAIARREGCEEIILETAHAESFYLRHGFTKSGERRQRGIVLHIMNYKL